MINEDINAEKESTDGGDANEAGTVNEPKNENGSNTKQRRRSNGKRRGRRRKQTKRPKPPVAMRQCALPDCKTAFYPERDWQKFHAPKCAVKDRQRRMRERYRKLMTLNSGDIVAGAGGRKVVSKRGSRELTGAEAKLLAEIRRIGQPAMDAVTAVLADPPRNRSPETPPEHSGSGQSRPPTHRIRNIGRVHPRSLEER